MSQNFTIESSFGFIEPDIDSSLVTDNSEENEIISKYVRHCLDGLCI